MYWSVAGAGSSSSHSDEGSLADDPTILAQYTGGSGIGGITPLVYNPQSDGSRVFQSGVWTGDDRAWQVVQVTDKQPGSAQSQESTPTTIAAADNSEDDDPNWRDVNRLIDKKTGKLAMWEDRAGGDSTNEAAKKWGPGIVSVLKNIGVIVATEGAPHAAGFWWFITKSDDALDLAKLVIAFAPGNAANSVRNIGRVDHAGEHLWEAGVIVGTRGTTPFRDAVRSTAVQILENPLRTFDQVIGGQPVKGFYGMIDGKSVAFFVAKEAKGKIGVGEVVTAFVPSPQQMKNWGIE